MLNLHRTETISETRQSKTSYFAPRSDPWWVTCEYTPCYSLAIWPIMCKRDVLHKTGSRWRIALSWEEDRATAVVDTCRTFPDVWTRSFWDMLSRQTDTLITILRTRGRSNKNNEDLKSKTPEPRRSGRSRWREEGGLRWGISSRLGLGNAANLTSLNI